VNLASYEVGDVAVEGSAASGNVRRSFVRQILEVIWVESAANIDNVGTALFCQERDFLWENIDLDGGERSRFLPRRIRLLKCEHRDHFVELAPEQRRRKG